VDPLCFFVFRLFAFRAGSAEAFYLCSVLIRSGRLSLIETKKVFWRYSAVLLCSFLAGSLLAGWAYQTLEEHSLMTNRFQRERAIGALEFLDSHAQSLDHWIPIVGTSEIHVGVKPDLIHSSLSTVNQNFQPLNLGFTNLSVQQMRALFLRLKEIVERQKKKFPLIIVNIPVDTLTEVSQTDFKLAATDEVFCSFVNVKAIWNFPDLPVTQKISLMAQKILYGGLSLEISAYYLWRNIQKGTLGGDANPEVLDPFFVFWYWPEFGRRRSGMCSQQARSTGIGPRRKSSLI